MDICTHEIQWDAICAQLHESNEEYLAPEKMAGYIYPADAKKFTAAIDNILTGDDSGMQLRYRIQSSNGTMRWLLINAELQSDAALTKLIGTIQDITPLMQELEETETRMARMQEALTQMTYAANHDLQEPLRKIMLYADMLDKKQSAAWDSSYAAGTAAA